MRNLHTSLAVVLIGAAFLAGCAGAPETKSAPAATTPPPAPSRPALPPATPPRAPDTGSGVSSEGMTIFELQERLNELGYKVGTVDGVAGPRTVEALKKYQSDNKLTPSGTVDPETIRKLRAAK